MVKDMVRAQCFTKYLFSFFFQFEQKKQKEPVPERGKSYVSTCHLLGANFVVCRETLLTVWTQTRPDKILWLSTDIP